MILVCFDIKYYIHINFFFSNLPDKCKPSASPYGRYENMSIIPISNEGVLRRSTNFNNCA